MQHNEDLDFLKGIGIFFVVLGHCFTTSLITKYSNLVMLKDIIYTFHMPLFFIVSGYIQGLRPYNINKLKKFSFHQIRRLLIPYFAWSIILYTFYFFLNNLNVISIPEDISLNPIYLFSDILTYNVRTGNALWFVYILFIIYIVSYLIHSFIDKKATNIFLIIIVLCLGFSANIYLKDEMFVLKRFLVMWIYYEIGTFIGIYIKDISFKANKVLSIILLGLYAFVFILYINSNGIISYSLKIICALLAVFVLYSLSKYNNSWFYRVFNYIGKRTSIIYYIHNPYIVLILITGLTMYTRLNIVISIAITFSVGFIVPLIIGELILTRIKITKLIFLGEKI